jgi:Xaa-Pro aminopeptidase
VTPVAIGVAADGRARRHRRPGVTGAVILQNCVVTATACRHGLHANAARTVSLGPKSPELKKDYDAACRVMAAHTAASRAGIALATALEAGRKTASAAGFEHAWRDLPPGHVTGWQPVERPFLPDTSMSFEAGWALVWQAGIGEALCTDTALVTDGSPVRATPADIWPVKRIHVHREVLDLPDVLVRD